MRTTVSKILSHGYSYSLTQRLSAVLGGDFDADREFNLADLAAHSKSAVSDVLWVLACEGKSVLAVEFARFCATTIKAVNADLSCETIALFDSRLTHKGLRDMANGMKSTTPAAGKEKCPVWRKRRATQQALLSRASTDPVHAAHYAAYAYQCAYQVNPRGLKEKLIELLLESDHE